MIIHSALNSYNKLLVILGDVINIWRIENALNNESVKIVPSYILINPVREFFRENNMPKKTLGIDSFNVDYVHSILMWVLNGRVVKVADNIIPFIYKINLLDHIDTKILFNYPCQSIYIDNKIGTFDGALVCKDFVKKNSRGNDYMLNISLIKENGKGVTICFVISLNQNEFNLIDGFEKYEYQEEVKAFFHIFFYILHGYKNKDDLISQGKSDFFGFELSDKIEQMKGMKGHWRNGHWHTYYVKNDGKDQFEMKLIQPTWVSG